MNADSRPNVLLLFTDQHRFDFLGKLCPYPLATPNLDRLAGRSLRFDAAYSPAPICGPARASFFTGRYPPEHGAVRNWMPMRSGQPLLTESMSEAGYQTALVGKLHLHRATDAHGFQWRQLCDSPHAVYDADEVVDNPYRRWIEKECFGGSAEPAEEAAAWSERLPVDDPGFWIGRSWCDDAHHMTTWTGDQAVRFLRQEREDRPFFLNVSFFGPHHPYATCEPWDSLVDPDEIDLPEDFPGLPDGPVLGPMMERRRKNFASWQRADWQRAIALYCGAVAQIDREVGRILEALEAEGLSDDTLIAFTADHGDHIGDMGVCGKGDFSESSARVPLLIAPPGGNARSRTTAVPVNPIDLRATLADYAGLEPEAIPAGFPGAGASFRRWIEEPGTEPTTREIFSINSTRKPDSLTSMIRRNGLKLIRSPGENPAYELIDSEAEPLDRHAIAFRPESDPLHKELKAHLDAFHEYHRDCFASTP